MYIQNSYNFSKISDASFVNTDIESLFVKITTSDNAEIIVGVVYRPPSGSINNFNNNLDKILSSLPSKKYAYIMGDFNINLFKDCKITSLFEESILSNGFFPTISIATHYKPNCKKSCIDNILTNSLESILSSNVVSSDISHHQSMVLLTQLCESVVKTPPKNNNSNSYDYSENNLRLLSQSLEKLLVESNNDVNVNDFQSLTDLIKDNINENCKVNKSLSSKRTAMHNPWITQGIIKSIRHRDKLYRAWKKTITKICNCGDPRKHEEYRKYRNNLSHLIFCRKKLHYENQFNHQINNKKGTWRLINTLRGKNKANLLHINLDKCCYMWLKYKNTKSCMCATNECPIALNQTTYCGNEPPIYIGSSIVKHETEVRYLGVILDPKLLWTAHIQFLTKKLKSSIATIKRVSPFIPKGCYKSLYHTLFESHLTYGISVWGNTSATNIDTLFRLQKRCLRILFGDYENFLDKFCTSARTRIFGSQILDAAFYSREHTKPIFSKNNILTVHNLYTYLTCTEFMKIIKYNTPKSLAKNITLSSRNNRNLVSLPKNKNRHFLYNASIIWNLSINRVSIPTIHEISPNVFKTKLKHFLITNQSNGNENIWSDQNTKYHLFTNTL